MLIQNYMHLIEGTFNLSLTLNNLIYLFCFIVVGSFLLIIIAKRFQKSPQADVSIKEDETSLFSLEPEKTIWDELNISNKNRFILQSMAAIVMLDLSVEKVVIFKKMVERLLGRSIDGDYTAIMVDGERSWYTKYALLINDRIKANLKDFSSSEQSIIAKELIISMYVVAFANEPITESVQGFIDIHQDKLNIYKFEIPELRSQAQLRLAELKS